MSESEIELLSKIVKKLVNEKRYIGIMDMDNPQNSFNTTFDELINFVKERGGKV